MEKRVFKPTGSTDDVTSNATFIKRKNTLGEKSEPTELNLATDGEDHIDKLMAENAMNVMKSLKFREVFKHQFETQGFEELYQDDPIFVY